MKRNVICVLLAVFMLIGSIFSVQSIQSIVRSSKKEIEKACHAYQTEKIDDCTHHLIRGESIWLRQKVFLGAVLSHEEIDDVIQGFSELIVLSQYEEAPDFFSRSASLLATLDQILDTEYPRLSNILCHTS